MKKLFHTAVNVTVANAALLILRLVSGGFMLTHGIGKFERLTGGGEIKFADPFGLGQAPSLALVVFAEVVCAGLIIVGLGTRLAAIPLIITMAVAAFIAHADDPFGDKEMSLMYLAMYVALLLMGSGKWSLDQLVHKKLM